MLLAACPEVEGGEEACESIGIDTGFGLDVDFVGRVDGEGGTATGGARLFTAPAAAIVVPLSVRAQFEVTPASLTFTPDDWDVRQQVTVRAKAGVRTEDIVEGTVTSLIVGPTQSAEASLRCQFGYTGFIPLPRCGDGVLDPHRGETCEGPQDQVLCPVGVASCEVCGVECRLITGRPNVCGDGVVVGAEECEGAPRRTCEQLGFDFGVSACSPTTCLHDTTDCVKVTRCDAGTAGCDPLYPALAPEDFAHCLPGADGVAQCWGHSDSEHHRPPNVPLRQLSDGLGHACGVTSVGNAVCWGRDDVGQATPRGGPYTKVVVGHFHACGLGTSGDVTCWGSDDYRLSQVPAGGPFVDLASGDNHVCALTQAGEARCWGRRSEAQTLPPRDARFTRLAAAANHGCGLTTDGALRCWGNFGPGRAPLTMPAFWPFVDLVVQPQDVCGLTAFGQVICASRNTGDLQPLPDFGIVSLGDASSGLCALAVDGRAQCWGQLDPREPLQGSFARVDTGGVASCGTRADGGAACGASSVTSAKPLRQVVMANRNTTCTVALDGETSCTMRWTSGGTARMADAPPVPFSRLVVFDDVACGLRPTGTVACWGNVANGGTGVPQESFSDFAHNAKTGCGVLATSGALSCWGLDPFGLRTPPAGTFTQVRMNRLFACALRTDGAITCWGESPPPPPAGTGYTGLAVGELGTCALSADAGLTCWGPNNPTGIPHALFSELYATATGVAARTLDGGLRAFGIAGAVGLEPDSVALVDAPIDALSVGARSFCAAGAGGVVCLSPEDDVVRPLREVTGGAFATDEPGAQCWLVDGGLPRCNFNGPVPQEPLRAFALGGRTLYGVTRDGGELVAGAGRVATGPYLDLEVTPGTWCARRDVSGAWDCLGDADAGVRRTTGPLERVSVALTEDLACGVAFGGAVSCWGRGLSRPMASVPAGAWSDVRLGLGHGCGLRPDASVQCWGESSTGALVAPAGAFTQVGTGDGFSCAVRATDRRLVCWGRYAVNAPR